MFLACCVLPDKKLYGNRLYWCKYVRDFDGATQRLKATVPDRMVGLPKPACVIVAVRLHKAAKDVHGALKGVKQSPRPCGPLLLKIALREMKHALKMHVPVCPYCIVFVYCDCTMYSTVWYSYKCSLGPASFVTPVHITQTATRLVQITHCIHETNFKISLP